MTSRITAFSEKRPRLSENSTVTPHAPVNDDEPRQDAIVLWCNQTAVPSMRKIVDRLDGSFWRFHLNRDISALEVAGMGQGMQAEAESSMTVVGVDDVPPGRLIDPHEFDRFPLKLHFQSGRYMAPMRALDIPPLNELIHVHSNVNPGLCADSFFIVQWSIRISPGTSILREKSTSLWRSSRSPRPVPAATIGSYLK
ncbi:unnamed protein product [Phytophthora fragariaefolia]|uniref:Unnamed protein product n=1 Tax=Phytophthora fragariaefolia TaxID=1490495 RepID=A0A9W7CU24_9STRA|nr:unnamed protein product [Phytophthora fragariaefolia]